MADKKKAGLLLDEKSLKKRYPESGLASEIFLNNNHTLRIPSSNLAINYHLGGGLAYGKVHEISGEESTGKTLLAIDFSKSTQALGGIVLWDDAEATFDGAWATAHGVDLSKMVLLPYENEFEIVSDWVADMCVFWRNKLTKNEPILLVIDSVAVMETGDAMETAQVDTKAEMGKRSFKMGEFLRKRNKIFAKYGITVLLINQLRKKIGATQWEDPNTTPLEQAIKFYAAIRLGLFKGKRLKNAKGKWVGHLVYVRTKKNKTAIPRDNIQAEVYFRKTGNNFGYHRYFGFDELITDLGIVERKMGRFYYKGNQIAHGEEAFREIIASDQELRSAFIKKLGINTISKTREAIAAIDYNLYPVRMKAKKTNDEEN